MPRLDVRAHRIAPAADLVPRVRRHVVDMARARDRPAEELGARFGPLRHDGRFRRVDVEMAGARVMDVFGEDLLEHAVEALHGRAVHVARAAARLEQEQRVGIQRRRLQIVRKPLRDLLHRRGVRLVLLDPLLGIELLHVAHRDRLDQGALLLVGVRLERDGLLGRRIRVRRLLRGHRGIQVRPPRPRFAPVADGAIGIALPGLAERPHRLGLGERIHHLEALVEERLGLLAGR